MASPSIRLARQIHHESHLPFLYQTPTILRRTYASDAFGEIKPIDLKKAAQHKISADWSRVNRSPTRKRRTIKPIQTRGDGQGRSRILRNAPVTKRLSQPSDEERLDHVPFQGVSAPATIMERLQGQTMTRHEFNVFKDILAQGANAETAAKEAAAVKQRRQRDSTGRARGLVRPAAELPDLLKPLAEEAESITAERIKAAAEAQAKEAETAKEEELAIEEKKAVEYRQKMVKVMENAKTDVELWNVFNTRLRRVVETVLEGKTDTEADLATLTTTFPHLLLHMSTLLRTQFRGSGYALAILPTLRRMGPSAFAMGATTDLFNAHMRILFESYSDLDGIVEILAEMDQDMYEYNEGTHALLDDIFQRAENAARGKEGQVVKLLWGMDRKVRALEKLEEWEGKVAERIGKVEARRADWARYRADGEEGDERPMELSL